MLLCSSQDSDVLRTQTHRLGLVAALLLIASSAFAQSLDDATVTYGIAGLILFFFIVAVLAIGDRFSRSTAVEFGGDDDESGLIPSLSDIAAPKVAKYAERKKVRNLKQGHDIKIAGQATGSARSTAQPKTFAVQPIDFKGMSPIPKLTVEVGQEVAAGDQLFFDKKRPEIAYCSPVSGEVVEVIRGPKRAIHQVVVLADKEQRYRQFDALDAAVATREQIVNRLLESGAWPNIIQRPFGLVADHTATPRDIFVSTFDSAPLAPDMSVIIKGREAAFAKGLEVLARLTEGDVHLGVDARKNAEPSTAFVNATGVKKHYFNGKHPVGNVGVQIHNIKPINKGEAVWTVGVQGVITIGTLFSEQVYRPERVLNVTGPKAADPSYYRTMQGAKIDSFTANQFDAAADRLVEGDVLSGKMADTNGYLGFYTDQYTVLEEGNSHELFGWLLPVTPRPSTSMTYPNFLIPNFEFEPTTNTHGERRAFVVTGQYERMLPMDIYPQHLLKAILMKDFEQMEGLGIYEVLPEDMALCEFACVSKQPVQEILEEGLEMVREQS